APTFQFAGGGWSVPTIFACSTQFTATFSPSSSVTIDPGVTLQANAANIGITGTGAFSVLGTLSVTGTASIAASSFSGTGVISSGTGGITATSVIGSGGLILFQ